MKVYLTEFIHKSAYEYLIENAEITNVIEECDAVITRNIIIDKEWINKAPKLKVIGIHGTGVDLVDIDYAKKRNIEVFNVPKLNALSVAELNVLAILAISRKINKINLSNDNMLDLQGNEISYKTVGFIGFGEIAKKTADILKNGFNMKVLIYNRSTIIDDNYNNTALDDVLKNSDYVILGLALNSETKYFIDKEKLNKMKKTAYLINTARGALIKEDDLINCLKNKIIQGYMADVFEIEPIKRNNPLLIENVIAFPHIGANTEEALYRVGMNCVQTIIKKLSEVKR